MGRSTTSALPPDRSWHSITWFKYKIAVALTLNQNIMTRLQQSFATFALSNIMLLAFYRPAYDNCFLIILHRLPTQIRLQIRLQYSLLFSSFTQGCNHVFYMLFMEHHLISVTFLSNDESIKGIVRCLYSSKHHSNKRSKLSYKSLSFNLSRMTDSKL